MLRYERIHKSIWLLLSSILLVEMLRCGLSYRAYFEGKADIEMGLVDAESLIQRTIPKVETALLANDLAGALAVLDELETMVLDENAILAYELGIAKSYEQIDLGLPYLKEAQRLSPENKALEQLIEKFTLIEMEEDESYQAILLGQALGAMNEWAWARIAFEKAVTETPDYAEGWAFLGKAQEMIGMDGKEALLKGYHLDSQSVSALVFLGDYYVTHEEPIQGTSLYRKAIELDATNDVLYASLAYGYVRAGDLQSAIEAFEEGLVAVPYSTDIRHAYLDFLLFYEVYLEEKALPVVEELGALSDYGMTINLYTGRIDLALGNFENAKVYLESVVNYEPDNLKAQFYLGVCLMQLSDREGAIRSFENALELDKDLIYTDQINSIMDTIK